MVRDVSGAVREEPVSFGRFRGLFGPSFVRTRDFPLSEILTEFCFPGSRVCLNILENFLTYCSAVHPELCLSWIGPAYKLYKPYA